MCIFRLLKASEIDVRVQSITRIDANTAKARLLLYKDARVDMHLLDEHFGTFGWQREHNFKDGRNYCRISVKDPKTGEWIVKEDVGVESHSEPTKGESSDSFKRAATCLGIGRELYTAGNITVTLNKREFTAKQMNGKEQLYLSSWVTFKVKEIDYDQDERSISAIVITDGDGKERHTRGTSHSPLFAACEEMNKARTLEQCQAVWTKYKQYQDTPRFVSAKDQKKQQFKAQ